MFQIDEQEDDIMLCVECDSEFTITKIDGDSQPVEFCPFCGAHMVEEDDEDFDEDEDEGPTLN